MSTTTVTQCRPRLQHLTDDSPAWYCTTHAGWVFADDECEGAIGSLHCNTCINTGCNGERCGCHDPADKRYVRFTS